MAIVKASPVGGCCSYSKMRFFGISISLFIFGFFIWATEGIATAALFLNTPSFEWIDTIPLDNSIGFISGLFAIIGGGIGLGFCCEKKNRTSQSCAIQAFLAFAIIGIIASLAALISNINSAMYMSYFISGNDAVGALWTPFLTDPKVLLDLLARDTDDGLIIAIMLMTSALFNFINFFLQFSAMVFICRGVDGYNNCECCCFCCIGQNQVTVSDDEIQKPSESQEMAAAEIINSATEYNEYKPAAEPKESNIEHGIENDECDTTAETEITVTKSTDETTVKSNDQELTVVESKTEVIVEKPADPPTPVTSTLEEPKVEPVAVVAVAKTEAVLAPNPLDLPPTNSTPNPYGDLPEADY